MNRIEDDVALDVLIATEVMGWTDITPQGSPGGVYGHPPKGDPRWRRAAIRAGPGGPHYSTDIADAFDVVERMTVGGWRYNISGSPRGHLCQFFRDASAPPMWESDAQALPRAICEAALLATARATTEPADPGSSSTGAAAPEGRDRAEG